MTAAIYSGLGQSFSFNPNLSLPCNLSGWASLAIFAAAAYWDPALAIGALSGYNSTLSRAPSLRLSPLTPSLTLGILSPPVPPRKPLPEPKRPLPPAPHVVSPVDPWVVFDPTQRIPPVSMYDTVRKGRDGNLESVHGKALMAEKRYVRRMKIVKPLTGLERGSLGKTEEGRFVLQQQATRACVPTAVAMLVMDRKGTNLQQSLIDAVRTTNLSDEENAVRWIGENGLEPVVLRGSSAEFFQNQLSSYGSGIVSIDHPQAGGHVIVLDRIERGKALIRDPYHGLSFEIPLSLFLSWKPTRFIGIRSPEREIALRYANAGYHHREKRLQSDPVVVQRKLTKEREAAAAQHAKQASNPFFKLARSMHTSRFSSQRATVNGREVGIAHDRGRRPSMEDEDLIAVGRANGNPYELFAIFDGHGGGETSKYLKENLQRFVQAELTGTIDLEIWNALKTACVKCDASAKTFVGGTSGSTGAIALKINGDLWIANVGDSRAIWRKANGQAIQLSEDQKPDDPKYLRSIEKRGGFVDEHRVNGMLAVARSFNDGIVNNGEKFSISARPKIVKVAKEEIGPGDSLILCCDGVPDVASSQDIADRAGGLSPNEAAKSIIGGAYAVGSKDNLSAMVIPLEI